MLKKKNLIFLSLLILGVLLLSSCFLKPPVTEGILKGQVMVPEGSKQLTGQALADATVNIIDPATGDIIATTTTDANGYYQVFVPAGGPYLLQVVKDGVVILQITPQVEVGIEYDLGIADCSTTAVALIALAMMDAGANLADINLAEIETDPDFDDVLSSVTSIIEAGGDPTASAAIQQAVEDFLSPPAPAPPPPTPTYTVTFDKNGGGTEADPTTKTATHGGNVGTLPTAPTRTGYGFTSWNTKTDGSGTEFTATTAVTANITVYAQWTINSYTVTFNSQGGSAVDSQTVNYGGKVTEPTAPMKTGYTFAGWYKELECTNTWDFNTDMVISDVTLYAKWTINSYTVTFDKNGGDTEANPMTKPATHGGNVGTLPEAPTKTNYTFTSWNTAAGGGGTEFTAATAVTADITVYAKWTINTYSVTFDPQGGSAVDLQTVDHGGLATEPTAPTKTGYAFGGWYKESGCTNIWDFATDTVTSDVTLYAKWTPLYALRDSGPAGGLIFYVKEGGYSDGWMYLEAALLSTEWEDKEWGYYGMIGGTETGIGSGQNNTTIIVTWLNSHSDTGKAAQLCDALTWGGYDDWFLPSKYELDQMYLNLKAQAVGGFVGTHYWSSSEFDANYAWSQFFGNGGQSNYDKDNTYRVRAVRAF